LFLGCPDGSDDDTTGGDDDTTADDDDTTPGDDDDATSDDDDSGAGDDDTAGDDDDTADVPCEPHHDFAEPVLGPQQVVLSYGHVARSLTYRCGHLFVPSNTENRVYVFDTETQAQVNTVPTDEWPYFVVRDDTRVYASNVYGYEVTVIDAVTGTHEADVHVGEFPWGVASYQGMLYTSFFTANDPYVKRVEVGTWAPAGTFDGESGPDQMVGAGDHIYLINGRNMFDGSDDAVSVHQIDGTLVTRLEGIGDDLYSIAAHTNGKVYVTASEDDAVVEIDPAVQEVTATFPTGPSPNGIASMGPYLFVADRDGPSVTVIDPGAGQTWTLDLSAAPTPVNSPRGITASANGHLYVESDDMVSVFTDTF